jgi:hypothetical protein
VVSDFVHEVQDALDEDSEFDFTGICEANEVYVVAARIVLSKMSRVMVGLEKRTRNLRLRQTTSCDTHLSL